MRFMKSYAAVAVLVVAGFAVTVSAQKDNNGNPAILEAVKVVQATVDTLATTVSGLVTSVDALNAAAVSGNTRFAGPLVAASPDSFSCTATNVAAAARTVKVELINGNTAALISSNGAAGQLLVPGTSTAAIAGLAGTTRAFCKFTVTDGVRTDIRGVLALYSGAGSDKVGVTAE